MTGDGSGRTEVAATGGTDTTRGASEMRDQSGMRADSWARGEPSFAPRRRSMAARARSLASRRSSGGGGAPTAGAVVGAATTGAAVGGAAGCTGAAMVLAVDFSRGV